MLYNQYQLRFNYKSGIQVEAWFYTYKLEKREDDLIAIEYHAVNETPLIFNVDAIESLWLVGRKRGILGDKK
jgi:hypothetical protein